MKRYTFTAQATSVYGSQTYYADAETEEEARAIVESGDGVFVCEELEVQDLDKFELESVDDIPEKENVQP
ncbi:hypothetical protein F0160_22515 [Paraburkholderia sp. JPY303]|uniref:hypothetical protein n=1 Tax=Paraburkholderia atlantica TaxID=2654982 RepID=UPI0015927266|nr:hypothetical protein [Paraburkholderia atlantica]NUY33261.1 hypothetical protein [Paraburkholderia atlantica]